MSSSIDIYQRKIGGNNPCFIIAEACDNHQGNIEIAKKMISEAKLAGADAVKFQHHLPEEEMLPNIPMSDNFDEPLYEFLKKYALSLNIFQEFHWLQTFRKMSTVHGLFIVPEAWAS